MNWLGLDVGGANLKIADVRGYARTLAFPLWKQSQQLPHALRRLIEDAPSAEDVAVTMTGELADCYESKTEGVLHILDAVEEAAGSRNIAVYLVDGRLASLQLARSEPLLAAASNWHALARFAARYASRFPSILLDIGSTTTDIIPLDAKGPNTLSRTDTDRLLAGELAYLGGSRTPVAAITDHLPYRGRRCPVAAELFATSADAAVLLGVLPECDDDCNTADGRPLTKRFAKDRMARMICADRDTFSDADAFEAASYVWNRQVEIIGKSLRIVIQALPAPLETILVSGSGAELAKAVITSVAAGASLLQLSGSIGDELSRCAPAHAIAVLASEEGVRE